MNAVIFDMDGVLIDSERVVLEGFRYAGKKTGVPNAERMAIMGLGLNDDAWIEKLRLEFGADAMRVLEYAEAYMAKFYAESAAPAKKGAQQLLAQLRAWKIPIAVASSSPAAAVRAYPLRAPMPRSPAAPSRRRPHPPKASRRTDCAADGSPAGFGCIFR